MAQAILNPLRMEDLDDIMMWINDPEVTKNFNIIDREISREEEHSYLENIIKSENDFGYSIRTEEGEYLGNVSIYNIHWPSNHGQLGIIIGNTDHWGEGYAQSAVKEVLQKAFIDLKLHKVWLVAWEENEKNIHMYKKLGFQEEGLLKDQYLLNGVYHNMVSMAMLENDFHTLYPK